MAKGLFSVSNGPHLIAHASCWPTFALLLLAATLSTSAVRLSPLNDQYESYSQHYWRPQLRDNRLPVEDSFADRNRAKRLLSVKPRSLDSKVGSATIDNDVVVPLSAIATATRSPKGGQLEMFSPEATGLGDLEPSEALKKINKRSLRARRPFLDDIISQHNRSRQQLAPVNEETEPRKVISENTLRQLIAERRPKATARDFTNLVRRMTPTTPLLSSGFRQLVIPTSTSDQEKQQPSSAASASGRPILVVRRTEKLLEQPVGESETSVDQAGQNEMDASEAFPLLGEFGSRISLLTTRKVQPKQKNDDFQVPRSAAQGDKWPEEQRGANVEEGKPDAADEIDSGDWLEPMSSRVLISLRLPTRPGLFRRHPAAARSTNGATGGFGHANLDGSGDDSQNSIYGYPVATTNEEEQRARDEHDRQRDGVLIMGSNYLPRIARAIM